MATETNFGNSGPPLTYQLGQVRVSFTRHPGAKAGLKIRRISISKASSAGLKQDGRDMQLDYAPNDLLTLLNQLYKIYFFDLPSRFNLKYSVFLKEDGSIGTSALRMLDALSTTVCFSLPTYEKCVTYGTDGPRELEQITQRVFSEAERLTAQHATD